MTKELLQQCLDALIESRGDVDLCYAGVKAARLSFRQERQLGFYEEQLVKHDAAIEGLKQALAQQEQCGCREGECETKKDKTCRMTIEIAERDGIPEWTPAIGIECAISSLRDDAARLRDGSYTPLQIADDLNVIANDLGKCNPVAQQEQPASVDAYVGAREDAAIWKKRALEAEELNRKFIADVNGPTYLGEPVKQEQPAQKVSESWTDIVAVNLVREGVNKHKARELAAHFLTLFAPPTPPAQEPFKWYDGEPPFPQNQESFIAQTIYGERVVLRVLPEEYTYDYTTADGTYMKAENIKKWMQFPDCEFLPPEPAPTQPALSEIDVWNSNEIMAANSEIGLSLDKLMKLVRAIEAHCRGGANG